MRSNRQINEQPNRILDFAGECGSGGGVTNKVSVSLLSPHWQRGELEPDTLP